MGFSDKMKVNEKFFDASKWMGQHYDLIKDIKLNEQIFAGSHDTGTYLLSEDDVITDWKKSQNVTVFEQLQIGARFFDLRPGSPSDIKDDLWIYHQVKCGKLVSVLADFKRFIELNPDEIIYIKHEINDNHLTQEQTEYVIEQEGEYLGKDKIVTHEELMSDDPSKVTDAQWFSFQRTTVKDMRDKKKNFVIFYYDNLLHRKGVNIQNPYFDAKPYLADKFLNKWHAPELYIAIETYLKQKTNEPKLDENKLYVSQAILTPPGGLRDFIDWTYGLETPSLSIKAYFLKVYGKFDAFVDKAVMQYSFNCIILDWIHYHRTLVRYLFSSNFRKVLTIEKAYYQGGHEVDKAKLQKLVSKPYNLKDWKQTGSNTVSSESRILQEQNPAQATVLPNTYYDMKYHLRLGNASEEGFGNIQFIDNWSKYFDDAPNPQLTIVYKYDDEPSQTAEFNVEKSAVLIGYYAKPATEEKRVQEDNITDNFSN